MLSIIRQLVREENESFSRLYGGGRVLRISNAITLLIPRLWCGGRALCYSYCLYDNRRWYRMQVIESAVQLYDEGDISTCKVYRSISYEEGQVLVMWS